MTPYRSTSGKASGVTAYEIGGNYIKVRFLDSRTYTYTVSLNGKAVIEQMKKLALASRGLSTYIAQHKERLKFK